MEISQFKRSVQEIAKAVSSVVEEKLQDFQARGSGENQFGLAAMQVAKQVEKLVSEALWSRSRERISVKFRRLENFKGELPKYETAGSSGLDLRACLEKPVTLEPLQRALVPTGLSIELPFGYEAQARPRSGLAVKKGLTLVNTPGTIDSDYRGEIKIILINLGQDPVEIQDQDRIAQLVICPVTQAQVLTAETLSETERASGGFGSTGV